MFIKRYIEASKKEASQIKNIIKRRIFLAFRMKIAGIVEDLKKFNELKKYFVTKEEANKKLKELQQQQKNNKDIRIDSKDIDWYEIDNDIDEFYVYSTLVVNNNSEYEKNSNNMQKNHYMIGKCYLVEFRRRGYDDISTLGGIYKTDNNGNVSGTMIGYKEFKNLEIENSIKTIKTNGIKGHGETFYAMDSEYSEFQQISNFAEQKLKEEIQSKQQKNEEQQSA